MNTRSRFEPAKGFPESELTTRPLHRRPTYGSLSDAAHNLYDPLRDETTSGWDARAKGAWNIESRNIVPHSSPPTSDEDFYNRFARPALEFMLSRLGPRFAAERAIGSNYSLHQPMRGPQSTYGAAVFASAHTLTHGRTPAVTGGSALPSPSIISTHSSAIWQSCR